MDEIEIIHRITTDPKICHGKPCIRGMRYPVAMIMEMLKAGISEEQILSEYNALELDDIKAVEIIGKSEGKEKNEDESDVS